MIKVEGHLAWDSHTTYITTAEERANITGVFYIVVTVSICFAVENDTWHQCHGNTFHIIREGCGVCQVESREVTISIFFQICLIYHTFTIVA